VVGGSNPSWPANESYYREVENVPDNRRWVVIALLVFGLIIGGITFLLFRNIDVMFRLSNYIPNSGTFVKILPFVIGGGVFLWLYKSSSKMSHLDDVVGEVRKVTWPTRKDTVASTVVVVIAILVIAGILGVYDAVCNWMIRQII
jgi:preprotein translocase subunit SecE